MNSLLQLIQLLTSFDCALSYLRPSVGSGKDTFDEWKGLDMLAVTFVRLGCPVAVQETAVHVVEVVGLEPEAELAVDESENKGKITSNVLCLIEKFYDRDVYSPNFSNS